MTVSESYVTPQHSVLHVRIWRSRARVVPERQTRPGLAHQPSNLLVIESQADMQKRGQASPDDGDALALTFAQVVAPAEVEERDEEDVVGRYVIPGSGVWMR
jgi:hypothetical protein